MTFEAGDIIRPGKHEIQTFPVGASTNVLKGRLYQTDANGNMVQWNTTTNDVTDGVWMAVENQDNSSGADRDKIAQFAGKGTYVVARMASGVAPGESVRWLSAFRFDHAESTDITNGDVLGSFIGQPGERPHITTADDELGVVLLGGS